MSSEGEGKRESPKVLIYPRFITPCGHSFENLLWLGFGAHQDRDLHVQRTSAVSTIDPYYDVSQPRRLSLGAHALQDCARVWLESCEGFGVQAAGEGLPPVGTPPSRQDFLVRPRSRGRQRRRRAKPSRRRHGRTCEKYLSLEHPIQRYEFLAHIRWHNAALHDDLVQTGMLLERARAIVGEMRCVFAVDATDGPQRPRDGQLASHPGPVHVRRVPSGRVSPREENDWPPQQVQNHVGLGTVSRLEPQQALNHSRFPAMDDAILPGPRAELRDGVHGVGDESDSMT